MDNMIWTLSALSDFFQNTGTSAGAWMGKAQFASVYGAILRYAFPVLAVIILGRCAKSLLTFRKEPEIWAWLALPSGDRLPVTHWENIIGRGRNCDLLVEYPTISRSHAVLTRYDDGSWTIGDVGSKGGVEVNGKPVEICAVQFGDAISLGGVEFHLVPITKEQESLQAASRTRAGREIKPSVSLLYLTLFQILTTLQLLFHVENEAVASVAFAFLGLLVIEWALFWTMRAFRRTGYEVEIIAFFLTTLGLAVIASSNPSELKKQLLCVVLGILAFLAVGWALRDLERAKKIRYLATAAGLGLLLLNLVFGTEQYGAKNWIYIGGMSFQPSELVKICFIFAGASAMDRLVAKRNLFLFIVYSGVICGCLALMNDFGTALVFFVAFLVIAYLRSGDFATLSLICAGTGFAGVIAMRFRPYIKRRFSAWGHIWEDPLGTGFQQTRAMMCLASGGLFGLGAGCGWLKYVAAADTDLVFAFVAEEWGLLIAVLMVLAIVCLCIFVVRSAPVGRSSFYTIGACAAVSILMIQTMLNVFGTLDFLPLTGVTFPFVSNGGSSMISAWGLLAFIKACDTRQNASFAIRLSAKPREEAEES